MTLADLTALCYEKIWQKNPLRLPETPSIVYSPKEYDDAIMQIVEQYEATSNYGSLLADAIREVYAMLYAELGITAEILKKFSPNTKLPPKTAALAEKLREFPREITEKPFPHLARLEFREMREGNPCFGRYRSTLVGTFESRSATEKWLEEAGFVHAQPEIWCKSTPSVIVFPSNSGERITVPYLLAYVEPIHNPQGYTFAAG